MTRLADHLHLRDPARDTLKLSPEHDARIFVDLDNVLGHVREQLRGAAPKLVVFGDIGTGKSQLLRHVEKLLAPERRFRPVYVVLSGFDRRSRFERVHGLVMQALERPLLDVLQLPEAGGWLERAPGLSEDVARALRMLRDGKKPADQARIRAWLKGPGVTNAQAHRLGLSGRLTDTATPVQLVDMWKQIGELYSQCSLDRAALLLLFDEGASIQQALGPEGQVDLGDGFRHVLDAGNRSIGSIFALNLPAARGEHPFLRPDLRRRYDDTAISLKPLGGPERVRDFIEALWREIADPTFPLLAPDGVAFVGNQLARLRERLGIVTMGSLKRTPTQADLLVVLDHIAQTAAQTNTRLPIAERTLRDWLQIVEA